MTTVREHIDRDTQGPLGLVIGKHGTRELEMHLQDLLTSTLHAMEYVVENVKGDATDKRRLVLRSAELAVAHYLTEAHIVRVEPDSDDGVMAAYEMPNVHIAQADDDVPLSA